MKRLIIACLGLLPLGACVHPYTAMDGKAGSDNGIVTQDQMAQTEEQDRVARFQRLASEKGIESPVVTTTTLPSGSVDFMKGPVPVVRVVFPERAFFAFGSADPLPGSRRIFDIVADNMKHDVPDAALTVLGHTDAVGTDAYNVDLSRRRASAVISELIARGVPASALTNVAIGKSQPIAPNDNEKGRALNRRVEFIISPAQSANLAAVQQVVVPRDFMKLSKSDEEPAAPSQLAAMVYKIPLKTGLRSALDNKVAMEPIGGVKLNPASTEHVSMVTPPNTKLAMAQMNSVHLKPFLPIKPVHLLQFTDVHRLPDSKHVVRSF